MTQQFGMYTLYQGIGVTRRAGRVLALLHPDEPHVRVRRGCGRRAAVRRPRDRHLPESGRAAQRDGVVAGVHDHHAVADRGYSVDGPDSHRHDRCRHVDARRPHAAARGVPDVDCTTRADRPAGTSSTASSGRGAQTCCSRSSTCRPIRTRRSSSRTRARSRSRRSDRRPHLPRPGRAPGASGPHHMTMPPPLARAL